MEIREYLKSLGIEFKEFQHEAVFTSEAAEKICKDVKGIHSKNLFLKERKKARQYSMLT